MVRRNSRRRSGVIITAARKDDLINQRNAYKQRESARSQKHEQEYQNYVNDQRAVIEPIRQEIEQNMKRFNRLESIVRMDTGYRSLLTIKVDVNQQRNSGSALSWTYEVGVQPDGSVVKETNSWSGLQATTPEELDSLQQTVDALKYLNSIDWGTMLTKAYNSLPQYKNYVTEDEPDSDYGRNFNQEIGEAAIEEFVGSDDLLYGNNGYSYVIKGETPKFYKVSRVNNYYIDTKSGSPTLPNNTYNQLVDKYTTNVKKDVLYNELVSSDGDVTVVDIV